MTSNEIKEKVLSEINNKTTKSHINLDECLIEKPILVEMTNAHDKKDKIKVWLVLEENPITHNGYGIAYDEDYGGFGICLKDNKNEWLHLGYYHSFLEALEAI